MYPKCSYFFPLTKPEQEPATAALQLSTVHFVKLTGCKKQHLKHHKQNHRITELSRLEKILKIIQSNCQPITTIIPPKPHPQVPHPRHLPKNSGDSDSTTSWGNLFQCLTTLPGKFVLLSCVVSFSSGTRSYFF